MKKYDHKKIEAKWQKHWEEKKMHEAIDNDKRPKFYGLIEFPYPSGDGLHVGHVRPMMAMDVICRKRRIEGCNVLYPIGWDAFGLPTENYAIKTGIHPSIVTKQNTDNFRRQLKMLGLSFDWSREINTTDPEYYKWTQWIFLQFFKRGLAYKKKMAINWCPSCKIGLANEEVVDGNCERCGAPAEKREKEQWMLAITRYANRLEKDLEQVNYLEKIKIQQKNWIGKKQGINITYPIDGRKETITVFTTRPDTNYGATFVVLAPENELVERITLAENKKAVLKYVKDAKSKTESERIAEGRKKTGVFTGSHAINHLTNKKMPIWVSDFVLAEFGTGALVGVPGHDLRDFEFAQEFGLEIIRVVVGKDGDTSPITRPEQVQEEEGKMINSGILNGLDIHAATAQIMDYMEEKGWGKKVITYHLRDWVFSRQHYWGEPIPVVFCKECSNKQKVPKNSIIIHGCPSNEHELIDVRRADAHHWIPWLKKELENRGITAETPLMPKSWQPDYDSWKKEFEKYEINKDTALVGHSCGCTFLIRWLGETKKRIAKLVLVAPQALDQKKWRGSEFWKDFEVDSIIKERVEEILIFTSNNDLKKRIATALKLEKIFKAQLINLEGRGHYNYEELGGQACPELLDVIAPMNSGWIPVPEKDLPVELPKVEKYQPTDTGESPLAAMTEWVNTTCPRCGGAAKRETDTMPNWAGSSWYYLAYIMRGNSNNQILWLRQISRSETNSKQILNTKYKIQKNSNSKYSDFDSAQEHFKYWLPVDWYNGGMEHTTLHLLYSRFWHKFLFDLGLVPTSEPYAKRTSHGLILAEGGVKMSKSKGNVINPDDIVNKFGADALRVYEMFMGPFDQPIAWSADGLAGAQRFLEKIWNLYNTVEFFECHGKKPCPDAPVGLPQMLHKTIKKVNEDIEAMKFNTAISQMMIFMNFAGKLERLPRGAAEKFLIILSPFAPHLAEELWAKLGHKQSIFKEKWPKYDPALIQDETIRLVLQVNGKVRDIMETAAGVEEEEAKKLAMENEKIKKWLKGKEVKKIIFVKGKLVNIVV